MGMKWHRPCGGPWLLGHVSLSGTDALFHHHLQRTDCQLLRRREHIVREFRRSHLLAPASAECWRSGTCASAPDGGFGRFGYDCSSDHFARGFGRFGRAASTSQKQLGLRSSCRYWRGRSMFRSNNWLNWQRRGIG